MNLVLHPATAAHDKSGNVMLRRYTFSPGTWEEDTKRALAEKILTWGIDATPGLYTPRRPGRELTVYRGATMRSARGIWWSTSMAVAEKYAWARSREGHESRVFRTTVTPDAIITIAGAIEAEVHVHPERLGDLTIEPHRGQRIRGMEEQQTARWLEHRAWELKQMTARFGDLLPGPMRPTLPDAPVRLYRGATPLTWDGPRWTSDRSAAQRFAAYSSRDGWEGRLYAATFPPSAIFTQQGTSVAVRPRGLEDLELEGRPIPA